MNEEIKKEFFDRFDDWFVDDNIAWDKGSKDGLWNWIDQKLKEQYLLGAKDMREAVKLNREGGFKDEMVSIALARIDEQAQQFISSLGVK